MKCLVPNLTHCTSMTVTCSSSTCSSNCKRRRHLWANRSLMEMSQRWMRIDHLIVFTRNTLSWIQASLTVISLDWKDQQLSAPTANINQSRTNHSKVDHFLTQRILKQVSRAALLLPSLMQITNISVRSAENQRMQRNLPKSVCYLRFKSFISSVSGVLERRFQVH